jgi:hypothetical protein
MRLLSARHIALTLSAVLLSAALLAAGLIPRVHAANVEPAPRAGATPVLVELFTSEGCSSCPPADALLAHLLKDQPVPAADILVLEEHVDYWDSLGWRDRFSSAYLTQRQKYYQSLFNLDDIYTPQIVVDGRSQLVGNDAAGVLRAVAQSSRAAKLALALSPLKSDGSRIFGSVSISSAGGFPKADLYAALVESMASTQVASGENGGRTLHHVSVVRILQQIGTSDRTDQAFSLAMPKDASSSNLRVIVFAQVSRQGAIIGAASSAAAPAALYQSASAQ